MAFWGVEVKPGKPYRLDGDGIGGRLHISKATLGDGSSPKKSFVQCTVGNKSPVLLCCLKPDHTDSCSLHIEFAEYDEVIFEVIGNRSVHLAGHYLDKGANFDGDGDDYDSYGEDIGESDSEQSSDYDTEDEYGGEFIDDDDDDDEDEFHFSEDDDTEMFSPSRRRNSGVIIEEIVDDEKLTNGKADGKRVEKKNQVTDSDGDNQKQLIASRRTSIFESESEDEDGLPISRPKTKGEKKSKKKESKGNKKKVDDGGDKVVGTKRKSEDGETERSAEELCKLPSSENGQENAEKPNKKKKKKEQTKEETKTDNITQEEPVKDDKLSTENVEKVAEKDTTEKKKKKKNKKNKKNKTEESEGNTNTEEAKKDSVVEVEDKKKEEAKATQVRSHANGLVVEELEMGKPDAKRASPGNKVSVCYIGKLKKNGKIFDSNVNRKSPFPFRLGVGQVIKGWDVGVAGMRVGDKRRLTIPPSMGYGTKGAAPAIPPNAWLVFDVELIAVR